jgi:hypothetical protein
MKNFCTENSLSAALFSQYEFNPFRQKILAATCGLVMALTALPAYAQNCAPRPAGLVGWWPLDETTGTTVADLGPFGISGTASSPIGTGTNSNPRSVTGFVGNGLIFHAQVRVKVGPNSKLDFGTAKSFTIDAWIKGNASPIVSNYTSGNTTGYYSLFYDGTRLKFEMGGTTPPTTWSGPLIPANTWTFVSVAVDRAAKTVTFYTSPSMSASVAAPQIPNTANAGNNLALNIGGCPGSAAGCNMVIDEVEVFDSAVAQPDLAKIFAAGGAGKCKAGTKGMTWLHSASNPQTGTITVGCAGCDAYHGDTACTQQRPLLCIYKPTPAFPLPSGVITGQFTQWSGGVVANTGPVLGTSLPTRAAANAYCAAQLNDTRWSVAEFHDGSGWNFQAYGGTVSAPTVPSTRFWVDINDQPANCWQ